MQITYADPPYLGTSSFGAEHHYGDEHEDAGDYDSPEAHESLINELGGADGWALSASSPSLRIILPMCPPEARVGAWVKPFASFKPNVNPAYAWEPVLFVPARSGSRERPTVRDWVSANITLKKGMSGVKPFEFSMWLFDLLGAEPEDDFCDLFPGSGAVSDAWDAWCMQRSETQAELVLTPYEQL